MLVRYFDHPFMLFLTKPSKQFFRPNSFFYQASGPYPLSSLTKSFNQPISLFAGCDKIKKWRVKKGKKKGKKKRKKKKGRRSTCFKASSSGLLPLRFYSVVGTRLCRSLFVSHHFIFSASPSGKLGFIF